MSNKEHKFITNISTPNYMKITLWSSPNVNGINFIKNKTLNTKTRREYASVELKLGSKIDKHILKYFKNKGVDTSKIVFISYIKINKQQYNRTRNVSRDTFTMLDNNNTIMTSTRNKYYDRRNSLNTPLYILSKGYGKLLLQHIEQHFRENGMLYIVLSPLNKSLIPYYIKLGYKEEYIPNNAVTKKNDNNMLRENREAVSNYMIMYKELQ